MIRETNKRKTSEHLLGHINQSIESSMSLIDEWDQTDFDELNPSLKQKEKKVVSATAKPSGN